MNKLFKGWKRNVGTCSLAIVCVLVVGWIRSQFIIDNLDFDLSRWLVRSGSQAGRVWVGLSEWKELEVRVKRPEWDSFWVTKESLELFDDPVLFTFRASETPLGRIRFFLIPYRTLIIPLALVSAYLLLRKP